MTPFSVLLSCREENIDDVHASDQNQGKLLLSPLLQLHRKSRVHRRVRLLNRRPESGPRHRAGVGQSEENGHKVGRQFEFAVLVLVHFPIFKISLTMTRITRPLPAHGSAAMDN